MFGDEAARMYGEGGDTHKTQRERHTLQLKSLNILNYDDDKYNSKKDADDQEDNDAAGDDIVGWWGQHHCRLEFYDLRDCLLGRLARLQLLDEEFLDLISSIIQISISSSLKFLVRLYDKRRDIW